MTRLAVGFAMLVVAVGLVAVPGVGAALAADECRGLRVCLPVTGPWVVIPARTSSHPARVEYELRCPLKGYVVAGTDVRLADPDTDVYLRGETGSPVSPGVTTSRAILFVATYVGTRRAPTTFRPFIGCVPSVGGGGRALTAAAPLRPTRPVTRRTAERRVTAGARITVIAACRAGETVVGSSHAVAFRTAAPPVRSVIDAVRVTRRASASRVTAVATASTAVPARVGAVVQTIAQCRRGAP